ncbi:DNA-3-methyladenine glycosylase family protein [Arundinibacter roseus]|uniref:DNA-3-methyladenine glycosylase II n=1 Tax=Arundinibacter roseus TaxID=2070510 RepID=A0A4R4KK94_9BACT|nr:DNA-3-methyladenine glycosylase [Arundinibacter roseus]TDB67346.1 DNA-3-methyladenine glycosylase 2 family protein [Arundinibacter roseus]
MPANAQSLAVADPTLAAIISQIPEPKVVSTMNVFQDLLSCIIEQQIHYRSTKKIFERMLKRADITILTTDNFEQFEEKALVHIKVSLRKLETVVAVVDFFKENSVDWNSLSDQQVRKKLSAIRGIGDWTIDMILLYTLNRPNIFPADDFHLKELMIRLYGLNAATKLKAQMMEIAEKWSPNKSLAVKYLLGWKEFQKQKGK